MRNACFIIALCLLYFTSGAQRRFVNGVLKDSTSKELLSGARISNITINDVVFSNKNGLFRIQVAEGDKLVLTLPGYNPHSFIYSSSPKQDTIVFYLQTLGKILPTVTISKSYNQYQIDSATRKRDFEQFRGSRLPTVSRSSGFGLALNLDRLFKKRYKYQKKNEKRFRQREEAAYIEYRYSDKLVSFYTGLEGQQLKDFKNKHTPSYQWLRKHAGDQEVLLYINEQLKMWKQQ